MWSLAEPLAAERGLEVLEIEFGGSSANRVVRVYLEKPGIDGSVTLEDCEVVSRGLADLLDVYDDVIWGQFMLEISSPGLNRPLRTAAHFERVVGGLVKLRLSSALEGRRNFRGRLERVAEGRLTLRDDTGKLWELDLDGVEKANYQYEFEQPEHRGGRRKGRR